MPQLAARLAGGFTTPVAKGNLDLAIQHALAEGMFSELEAVRNLPGMTRAVSRTLRKVWDADVDLRAMGTAGNIRVRELALIEERVRMHLPKAMLIRRDLRDTALSRIHHAARVIGPLTITVVGANPTFESRRALSRQSAMFPKEQATAWTEFVRNVRRLQHRHATPYLAAHLRNSITSE